MFLYFFNASFSSEMKFAATGENADFALQYVLEIFCRCENQIIFCGSILGTGVSEESLNKGTWVRKLFNQ